MQKKKETKSNHNFFLDITNDGGKEKSQGTFKILEDNRVTT